MTPPNRPPRPSLPNKSPKATRQERHQREAEALRANLKKRKQQTRVRAAEEESKH